MQQNAPPLNSLAATANTKPSPRQATPQTLQGGPLLFVLFALLAASQIALARLSPTLDHISIHQTNNAVLLMALIIIPAAALFASLNRLTATPLPHHILWAMLATGLIMRIAHFGAGAIAETDHFRYLWDGGVLAHGHNPHSISPQDALAGQAAHLLALVAPATEILKQVNFPDLRTIYPATAQVAFALAHLLIPWSLDGLRIVVLGAEITTVWLLLRLLRERGASPMWAAAYWLNPLIVLNVANQAHIDALIPPLLLGAILALWHRHAVIGAVLIGLAAGVKIWPLLLVPLAIRTIWPDKAAIARALAAGTIVTAAVMAPVLLSTLEAGSGLSSYAGGWAMNNPFYFWVSWTLWAYTPASIPSDAIWRAILWLSTIAISLAHASRPVSSISDLTRRAMIVAAAVFYFSPAEFPWYALWFLPLAAAVGCRPLLLAAVLLPVYYSFFPLAEADIRNHYIYGVAFLHGLPVMIWIAWSGCWRTSTPVTRLRTPRHV